jgi:hypothetical protein
MNSRRPGPILLLAWAIAFFGSGSAGAASDATESKVPGSDRAPAEAELGSDPQPAPVLDESTDSSTSPTPPTPPKTGPPAPIGTRHSRALDGKQLRLGYSFERIRSTELFVGDRDRTQSEVLIGFYQQAPTALDVTIHDFEAAYAPHPRVTLVLNVPFVEKELQRLSLAAGRSEEQTDGIGDLQLSVIVPFIQKGRESSQFHIGVKAPTGSIRRGGDLGRLPYDLQIGNGTWDLEWGWTYRGDRDVFSWGAQFYGIHPVGTNGLHYRAGARFNASMWSALRIVGGLSASLRLGAEKRNNIRGFDRSLSPMADGPSSNDKARGGFRVDLSPGVSLEIPQLNHQTLSVEVGLPIHRDLDGPQLAREWSLKAGWQWVF